MNTLAYLALPSATREKSFITLTPGVKVVKAFHCHNFEMFLKNCGVCPWQVFPATSNVCDNAVPTNIRLGYKCLPGTTTLAYYEN